MRHFVIVGILVIATSILTYLGLICSRFDACCGKRTGSHIDWMWNLELIAMSFFLLRSWFQCFTASLYFGAEKAIQPMAEHMEGNTTLEIAWTVIPLFLVRSLLRISAR